MPSTGRQGMWPHDSERTGELRNIDHHIENNGTVQDLYEELGRRFA